MATDWIDKLGKLVESELDRITELRHQLHRIPEPAFAERETSALVAQELEKLDLKVQTGIAGTGVVAELDTGRPGHYVALRADMDALPIKESAGLDYGSQRPGFSHSCGHDGHAATLVGTARILVRLKEEMTGRVRLIFQPAEETGQGAQAMIAAGAWGEDKPEAIVGMHCWPDLPAEAVGCMAGTMLASCDVIHIQIIGKGGHGARPERAQNPLHQMARVIEALSQLNTDTRVVSLCTVCSGVKPNVIPDEGELTGTLRSLRRRVRQETMEEINSIVQQTCANHGYQANVSFRTYTPAVITDDRLYALFREVGSDVLGIEQVREIESPSMGSEDFGYYLAEMPGLLFRVGMGPGSAQLHQADFNYNDEALRTGMLMLSGLAMRFCRDGFTR